MRQPGEERDTWQVAWSLGRLPMPLVPRVVLLPFVAACASLARHNADSLAAQLLALITVALFAVSFRVYSRVTIGREGLMVVTPFRRRFFPFRDLLAIHRWPSSRSDGAARGVDLVRRHGAIVHLYTALDRKNAPDDDLVRALADAFARYQADGSRDVTAWAEDLVRLGGTASPELRVASVDPAEEDEDEDEESEHLPAHRRVAERE